MYSKLIECAINAVINPQDYMVWGISFEVPLKYGVLNRQMLLDQRDSSTMSDEAFLRESQSVWTGNNSEAWFDSKRINKRRKLLKCERQRNPNLPPDGWYIVSCDIARYQANTAIMVIKVLPRKDHFQKNVVYTEVIHGANYITDQAPRLKELIELYQPREIVIDGNGRTKVWPT